jgi:hypothetical protein
VAGPARAQYSNTLVLCTLASAVMPANRGSHSSTFQLNFSALCVTGGAVMACFGGVQGVVGDIRGV